LSFVLADISAVPEREWPKGGLRMEETIRSIGMERFFLLVLRDLLNKEEDQMLLVDWLNAAFMNTSLQKEDLEFLEIIINSLMEGYFTAGKFFSEKAIDLEEKKKLPNKVVLIDGERIETRWIDKKEEELMKVLEIISGQ